MPSANAGFKGEFSCGTLKAFNGDTCLGCVRDEQSEATLKESIFPFPISPHLGLLDYPTNMS